MQLFDAVTVRVRASRDARRRALLQPCAGSRASIRILSRGTNDGDRPLLGARSMIGHYLTIALRNFRRSPFTASINVFALALGLAAFVAAYGVVSYWERSERHFENADRTYVVTAALAARDGSIRTGGPRTNRL